MLDPYANGALLLAVQDEKVAEALAQTLSNELDVVRVTSIDDATEKLYERRFDVVVTDHHFSSGETGLELLERAFDLYPCTAGIVLTDDVKQPELLDAQQDTRLVVFENPPDPDHMRWWIMGRAANSRLTRTLREMAADFKSAETLSKRVRRKR